jgi:AraC-like DNA-binding protein
MDLLEQISREINLPKSSIYVMRDQLEDQLPLHQHPKSQILLVEGGLAFLETINKQFYIPARHYVWIPPDVAHNVKFNTSGITITNIYFQDEEDLAHSFYGQIGIYPVTNLIWEMIRMAEQWQGKIHEGDWRYEFLTTFKHTLPQISTHPVPIVLPTTDHPRLVPILKYLAENLIEMLDMPAVAKKSGLSVRTLTRLFKLHLDTSFLQYIKLLKIVAAMEMLLNGDKNISEVAYAVGYSNIAAFSNSFQQSVNRRPSEFARLRNRKTSSPDNSSRE